MEHGNMAVFERFLLFGDFHVFSLVAPWFSGRIHGRKKNTPPMTQAELLAEREASASSVVNNVWDAWSTGWIGLGWIFFDAHLTYHVCVYRCCFIMAWCSFCVEAMFV